MLIAIVKLNKYGIKYLKHKIRSTKFVLGSYIQLTYMPEPIFAKIFSLIFVNFIDSHEFFVNIFLKKVRENSRIFDFLTKCISA